MEKTDILNATQLMQVSIDLSVYRQTLAYALGNLVIMTIISSSLIIVLSLIESLLMFLIFWVIISIGAILVHVYVFRHVFRRIGMGIWTIAYPAIVLIGYAVNFIINSPLSTDFLWFPLLGFASLVVGITAERAHYSNNMLFSRPILLLGIIFLISSPVVALAVIITPVESNIVITAGIALILASLSTSYSMYQAEKKVVNK